MSGETAWRGGRLDGRAGPAKLLFGRMYEDWRIEAEAFAPGSRVFGVASAGCTALALAGRGHDVTAVDINPTQIEYLRERIAGAPPRDGSAERLMGLARRFAPGVGWRTARLRRFLELRDPREQVRAWDSELDTARLRLALRLLFAPRLLRLLLSPRLLRALPDGFPDELRRRLRRAFANHPNRENPYAWRLLLGASAVAPAAVTGLPLRLSCADAAEFLEGVAGGRFQAFTLSNVLDGADEAYAARLFRAVKRAAAPGAIVVTRSFMGPATPEEEAAAARDRGILWGCVAVREATALPD